MKDEVPVDRAVAVEPVQLSLESLVVIVSVIMIGAALLLACGYCFFKNKNSMYSTAWRGH